MRFPLQALLCICVAALLHGADATAVLPRLASEEAADRAAALRELALSGDPRLIPFLEDYRQGSAYLQAQRIVLVPETTDGSGVPLDPLTRAPLGAAVAISGLTELTVSRRERIAATEAINRLRLADPNPDARLAAVTKASETANPSDREILAEIAATDADARIRRAAAEGTATIDLASADAAARIAACARLADLHAAGARDRLAKLAAEDPDPAVKTAAVQAKAAIDNW
ncbi:MAG: hypothetical protein J0M02_06425, partial [Planctomycetes bacterium]|nr:hypothetical protein [Planctomycetota bacterium]